jgi:acid phosphatase (class A)
MSTPSNFDPSPSYSITTASWLKFSRSTVILSRSLIFIAMLSLVSTSDCQLPIPVPTSQVTTSVAQASYFSSPAQLHLEDLIPSPPTANSARAREDLAEVHRVEHSRTPAEVQAARYDDTHEDIFIYADVLGKHFNAQSLPLTFALSKRLRQDAASVGNPLKLRYGRLRPYNFDHTLHPVCEINKEKSYPSGHSTNGYLYAFTLAEIVPEKHDEILRLADEYAHNRVVCGSHYPSDTVASRRVATFLFGYLLANPRFQADLDGTRRETRAALGLSPLP